jgi:hypothetical protein
MLDIDARTNKVRSSSTSADIVILGCYDPETGMRLFEPVHKTRLLQKNSAALERLAATINRLSGIGVESEEKIETLRSDKSQATIANFLQKSPSE